MITFNKSIIKDNLKYLFGMLAIVIIIVIISILTKDNNIEKASALENDGESSIGKLVINEVVSNNGGAYNDTFGNSYDWIELYNGSNKDINLSGYTLSDDSKTNKWAFKNTVIESKKYLIIFLSGTNEDEIHTNFSLKKEGGEVLTLKNPHGKVIDIVKVLKTGAGNAQARRLNGEWDIVTQVTPGYINTVSGYNSYIGSIENLKSDLLINEVLVRNGGQFKNEMGQYSGYIELKNNSDKSIDLGDYSLSNSMKEPFRWKLPKKTLGKGEIILIYTSGDDVKEVPLHTDFKLNSKNGNVILSKSGAIVGKVTYENLANGYALSYINGSYTKTGVLTGGYENTLEGAKKFFKKYIDEAKDIVINEVMNSNYSYIPQNSNNYYDWIELKNNSNKEINLKDYYLSDSIDEIEMYKLPDVTLKPGEYYVIMASGDINLTNNSYYHANFKIGKVDSLYLSKDNKVIDSMFIALNKPGYSYGRGDLGFIYMANPTPGAKNSSGNYDISEKPEVSLNEGNYDNEITLAFNTAGNIYYTLNGDNPTIYSKKYTEPITISKTSTVKAINIEDDKYQSEVSSSTYLIGNNHTLPVVSISIDSKNYKSVVSSPWSNIEKEAYVTYIDGDTKFSIPCGFQLFGGSVRGHDKKSFALKFKKEYGEASLHYKVFENRDNSNYDTLVLRSGSQDSDVALIRDIFMTSLMEDSNVLVQAMKPVILYINGEYWGIYFLNEKVDEDFIKARYNVGGTTNIIRVDGEVNTGSGKDYEDLLKYLAKANMKSEDTYNYVSSKINMDSMLEFWIAETYITNNDIINCRLFSNPNHDDGRWSFIFYDLDYGMYFPSVNYYEIMTNKDGMGSLNIRSDLTYYLFQNPTFRKKFLEKLEFMLKNNWSEEYLLSKIDYFYNLVKPEMEQNAKRWGFSYSKWEDEVEKLRTFVKKRKSYLLSQTKRFFNLSEEEMKVFYE